jgi:acyl carrier protein
MREQIRAFITTNMIRDPNYPLQDDEPLITGGLIDSFSLVELALFVEQNFGIHLDDFELTADNMDTLDSIIAFVEAKQ